MAKHNSHIIGQNSSFERPSPITNQGHAAIPYGCPPPTTYLAIKLFYRIFIMDLFSTHSHNEYQNKCSYIAPYYLSTITTMQKLFLSYVITCLAFSWSFGQLTEKPLGTTAAGNGYIEYLPSSYTTNTTGRLPILLFFHGIGEGGNGTTDLEKVYMTGLPQLIQSGNWTYKNDFVVLMPQHNSTNNCFTANEVKNFLDFARKTYRIDTQRVYLTGLSCGAIGIWNYIGANPGNEKVAAAVLIAGDGKSAINKAGCSIQLPIWAFHGDADNQVNYTGSEIPINYLNTQCPDPKPEAKLTLYPGVGHNSWNMTYNLKAGHDIYAWLLKYTSPSTVTSLPANTFDTLENIRLYPNPSHDALTVHLGNRVLEKITIQLQDNNGKQLQSFTTNGTEVRIALGEYPAGLYSLSVETLDSVQHLRFIKQ